MRRHYQLCGCVLMAFGAGILLGTWLSGGFWCHCLGFGLVIGGFFVVRKK